jgi:hypothetical protein
VSFGSAIFSELKLWFEVSADMGIDPEFEDFRSIVRGI